MRWVRAAVVLVLVGAIIAKIAGYEAGTALLVVVAFAEVGLAFFVLRAAWSGIRTFRTTHGDPWASVETSLGQLVPPAAVPFLISEIRIFVAFFRALSFRPIAEPVPGPSERKVTARHTSQYGTILFVLLLLILIEVPVVHVILAKVLGTGGWKTVLQRVLIGLSVYGAIPRDEATSP